MPLAGAGELTGAFLGLIATHLALAKRLTNGRF